MNSIPAQEMRRPLGHGPGRPETSPEPPPARMGGRSAMSALGQKQTCAAQNGMSALTPEADMCGATRYVRFVPKADTLSLVSDVRTRFTAGGC